MTQSFDVGAPGWAQKHLANYLETDGASGHYLDFRPAGGFEKTPTLILKTIGRKSGNVLMTPLIYGRDGDRIVIIGSRGGNADHPAWYLNLTAAKEVEVQVAEKKTRATWEVAEGAERARIWNMMVEGYPPFADYQKNAAPREIPVIVLTPGAAVDKL